MVNTLILGISIFTSLLCISVVTWSIRRMRAIGRAQQQADEIEKIAGKLYLVVMDMLVRLSPDKLSPENVQPYESLIEETKEMYRELAKRYFLE